MPDKTETNTKTRDPSDCEKQFVRLFHLCFSGQDNRHVIQQGEICYESGNGKFTKKDVETAKIEHCKRMRSQGIEIYPEKCMITSIFELDA